MPTNGSRSTDLHVGPTHSTALLSTRWNTIPSSADQSNDVYSNLIKFSGAKVIIALACDVLVARGGAKLESIRAELKIANKNHCNTRPFDSLRRRHGGKVTPAECAETHQSHGFVFV